MHRVNAFRSLLLAVGLFLAAGGGGAQEALPDSESALPEFYAADETLHAYVSEALEKTSRDPRTFREAQSLTGTEFPR